MPQSQRLQDVMPLHYNQLIADKLIQRGMQVTATQVMQVVYEKITDRELILAVLETALAVHEEQKKFLV